MKKWKLRAVCDERRTMEEKKQEENSNGVRCHLSHLAFAPISQLKVKMWFLMSRDQIYFSLLQLIFLGYLND